MSNETVSKKEFLHKWKEVEQLMLNRDYIKSISIVTNNEKDNGLSSYEQSQLSSGKFPKSLYDIDNRINALYAKFDQWLEERASMHVMINQLLEYKVVSTTMQILDSIQLGLYIDPDKDYQLQRNAYYKTLINLKKHNRVSYNNDLYEAVHEFWHQEVRMAMNTGEIEAPDKMEVAKTTIPEQSVEDQVQEQPVNTEPITNTQTTLDMYYQFLESQCSKLRTERDELAEQMNQLYIKLGKHYLTLMS